MLIIICEAFFSHLYTCIGDIKQAHQVWYKSGLPQLVWLLQGLLFGVFLLLSCSALRRLKTYLHTSMFLSGGYLVKHVGRNQVGRSAQGVNQEGMLYSRQEGTVCARKRHTEYRGIICCRLGQVVRVLNRKARYALSKKGLCVLGRGILYTYCMY